MSVLDEADVGIRHVGLLGPPVKPRRMARLEMPGGRGEQTLARYDARLSGRLSFHGRSEFLRTSSHEVLRCRGLGIGAACAPEFEAWSAVAPERDDQESRNTWSR